MIKTCEVTNYAIRCDATLLGVLQDISTVSNKVQSDSMIQITQGENRMKNRKKEELTIAIIVPLSVHERNSGVWNGRLDGRV